MRLVLAISLAWYAYSGLTAYVVGSQAASYLASVYQPVIAALGR